MSTRMLTGCSGVSVPIWQPRTQQKSTLTPKRGIERENQEGLGEVIPTQREEAGWWGGWDQAGEVAFQQGLEALRVWTCTPGYDDGRASARWGVGSGRRLGLAAVCAGDRWAQQELGLAKAAAERGGKAGGLCEPGPGWAPVSGVRRGRGTGVRPRSPCVQGQAAHLAEAQDNRPQNSQGLTFVFLLCVLDWAVGSSPLPTTQPPGSLPGLYAWVRPHL